mgnify:CR=1 FL=1
MALKKYELVLVFSLSKGEEAVETLKAKFLELIKLMALSAKLRSGANVSLLILSTTKQRVITLLLSSNARRASLQSLTV